MPDTPQDTPFAHFEQSAALLAERMKMLRGLPLDPTYLQAETIALQVRKIVEGVAFGALSALEQASHQPSRLRTKDADKILAFLHAKGLLSLPKAQDVTNGDGIEFTAIVSGAGARDLSHGDLKKAFSATSAIVHERHPERMSALAVREMHAQMRILAARFDDWLWNHTVFYTDRTARRRAFLVQMGMLGTPSFCVDITKVAEAPPSR